MRKWLVAYLALASLLLPAPFLYAERIDADLNSNGVSDLQAFFNSNILSKTELDRNEDGKPDVWMYFASGSGAWDTRADYDENYNGVIDEVFFLRKEQAVRSFIDRDQDGLLDEEVTYAESRPTDKKTLAPPLDPKKLEFSPK